MAPTSPFDEPAQSGPSGDSAAGPARSTAEQPAAGAADAGSAPALRETHRGAIITVTAHQNAERAWIADISISLDGRPMELLPELRDVEPVTPEWVNESEALRAGVERGRYLIDRTLRETSPHLSADPQGRRTDDH